MLSLKEGAPFKSNEFREMFPLFTDSNKFPDIRVIFHTNMAMLNLDASIWGETWVYGCALYVAHNLAVEQNMNSGKPGSAPNYGYGTGGVSTGYSKSVGDVSKSETFDTSYYKSAGDYASTEWGRMLWRYMRMFGSGGMVAWNTAQTRLGKLRTGSFLGLRL